jgi:hypothetical protein
VGIAIDRTKDITTEMHLGYGLATASNKRCKAERMALRNLRKAWSHYAWVKWIKHHALCSILRTQ